MNAPSGREMILAEEDYCYGSGPIRIRVEKIDRVPVDYHGEAFYRVEGVQLNATGAEVARREILVRGRRLQRPAGPVQR
jgi:hypothetical protein